VSESASPADAAVIVADTVVVNYFVAVGEFDLLRLLLGGRVHVPRAVFDPDEPGDIAEEAASELRRGLRLHQRRANDRGVGKELRERSASALPHFENLANHASRGEIVALELTLDEMRAYARLRDARFVAQYGLITGLGHGEAAAIAIALERGFGFASDDQDAIKVARALAPTMDIHRIRGLLVDAATKGLIDKKRAKEIHSAMVRAGFWDSGTID
jgi:predicted nucleic acid-binding protein